MKTPTDIGKDVDRLIEGHYYSEDYELEWAGKAYVDSLSEDERRVFEAVMVQRLSSKPGLADVSVCARLALPSLTPSLAALLDKEPHSSAMSRALLAALAQCPDERAYAAVERFMESEQEGEALACLARMNFKRALPHLRWAMQKDHLHNFCIHALHEYMRHAGMDALLESVRKLVEPNRDVLTPHLRKILTSKKGSFNPFSEEELDAVLAALI